MLDMSSSLSSVERAHMLCDNPIAIVGLSCLFPQSSDVSGFWQNIMDRKDCISEVPSTHWSIEDYYDPDPNAEDKTYCKRGGFIPPTAFNPVEFGIPPSSLDVTDILQLLSLVTAKAALKDAGYETRAFNRDRTGVILGVTGANSLTSPLSTRLQYPTWEKVLRSRGIAQTKIDDIIQTIKKAYAPWEENSFPGMLGNVVAGRIANRLDLGATNCTVDAACASSLSAMRMAIDELVQHRADMMITGGCDAENTILMFMCFSKTPAFSPAGIIRPFDTNADGTLIGEGMGMLVLKRLDDAERDRDRIYAVIKGLGSSSDGRFKSIYAPRAEGQIRCLKRAYEDAGFSPGSVGLIEAHGTGTAVGDATEVGALLSVLGESDSNVRHIALGSVKSQIGHTKAAAGAAGAIKATLSLHHRVLPASINVDEPNPALGLENSLVYVNTRTRPWFTNYGESKRRAGISSFGFGGTNFHLVLEEYSTDENTSYRLDYGHQPCVISASTPADLMNRLSMLLDMGVTPDTQPVFDQEIPSSHARIGWVSSSQDHWREQLQAAITMLEDRQHEASVSISGLHYRRNALPEGKVAALFPGQGSQHLDMGSSAVCAYPVLHRSFSDLDEIFCETAQTAPTRRIFPPPGYDKESIQALNKELQETRYAQPSIGAMSMGLYRMLSDAGLVVDMAAGHSFGELTALWAAGSLDDAAYLQTAIARGRAMSPPEEDNFDSGTMIALSTSSEHAQTLVSAHQDVWLCNLNTPAQQVVGGTRHGIEALKEVLLDEQISFTELSVSGAFHTPLVEHAAEVFSTHLAGISFSPTRIPVYRNRDGSIYPEEEPEIRCALSSHLLEPVHFNHMIEAMYRDGARVFVEFGPKPTLTRMVSHILGKRAHLAVALDQGVPEESARSLMEAVVKLRVAGITLSNPDIWRRPPTVTQQAKGPVVWLNGVNHVSESRRKAFQNALVNALPKESQSSPVARKTLLESSEPITDMQGGHLMTIDPVVKSPDLSPQSDTMNTHALGLLDKLRKDNTDLHATFLSMHQSQVNESFNALRRAQDMLSTLPDKGDNVRDSLADIARLVGETHAQTAALHQQYLDQNRFLGEFVLRPEANSSIAPEGGTDSLAQISYTERAQASSQLYRSEMHSAVHATVDPVMAPSEARGASRVADSEQQSQLIHGRTTADVLSKQGLPDGATFITRQEVEKNLLNVVSEKTGYATDMLDVEMDIESDLGIDSIKRVEILSAMHSAYPQFKTPGPEEMGELRTLSQILDYFLPSPRDVVNSPAPAVPTGPASETLQPLPDTAHAGKPVDEANLQTTLLNVVADKTGYPLEVLEMSMDLESDLGIDSIKRVEILASLQSANPDFVPPSPESMTQLRTLQQILDAMSEHQKKNK